MLKSFATFIVVLGIIIYFYINCSCNQPKVPTLPTDIVWKSGKNLVDERILPFSIDTSRESIKYLKERLRNTTFTPPLNGINFEYGFNTKHMKNIIEFWINNYDWEDRKKRLNAVPHFRTKISGLYIHFIHVKPDIKISKSKKVLPILLLHGWPGSVKEFYAIFSHLTQPRPKYDFVFEVIAPSLPGYGFSDAAEIPGMNTAHIALIMKKLMNRLGFQKFVVQGGDWGSLIGSNMATLFPESIIGYHSNLCTAPFTLKMSTKYLISSIYPDLFVPNDPFKDHIYPISNLIKLLSTEFGYFCLQATKPDTVGVALTDSPAGLATYILEKFSTWTNYNWRQRADGGLSLNVKEDRKYNIEDLLDNVMIYWITNSITTSIRLYSEQFSSNNVALQLDYIPTEVPTACTNYPYDLVYMPEFLLKEKFHNLVHFVHMSKGGHFAAFEEPELFATDIWKAVCKIENFVNKMDLPC